MKILRDDIDPSTLPSELSINTICEDENPAHFDCVLSIVKALSTNEKLLMKTTLLFCKSY